MASGLIGKGNGVWVDESVPARHVRIIDGPHYPEFAMSSWSLELASWCGWDMDALWAIADQDGTGGTYPLPLLDSAPEEDMPLSPDLTDALEETYRRALSLEPGHYGGRCAYGCWDAVVDVSRGFPVCGEHHRQLQLVEAAL